MRRADLGLAQKVTPAVIRAHGLNEVEFAVLCKDLGREPNLIELGMYSAMWSEHCSYKNTRPLLKQLPTRAAHVLQGPGENAGVVRLRNGMAVAFKIESHNHPSFVEPFHGAATGVGGILRDILAMGARPIAVLDSLHFGPKSAPDAMRVRKGVVAGIAHYGNCIGVPVVGGELREHTAYTGNPLVNVMAIGVVGPAGIKRAAASGAGNAVLVFGQATGRDGVHGASFASTELGEDSAKDRPSIQIGDPFLKKKLLEACQALYGDPALVAIQDMGAAGLTCATVEMSAKGGVGMDIQVDAIPVRDAGITTYELMLSETQERMMAVVHPSGVSRIGDLLESFDVHWAVVGTVIEEPVVRLRSEGEIVAEVPATSVADGCPFTERANRRAAEWNPFRESFHRDCSRSSRGISSAPRAAHERPGALLEALTMVMAHGELRSKADIFQQYDHMVGLQTLAGPEKASAAILRIFADSSAEEPWLAATVDSNHRYCSKDPWLGTRHIVFEAARNLACAGATPLGVTNGLNFGSPESSDVFESIAASLEGMASACLDLDVPITGGNASLYNQTETTPIPATPIIGMVGLCETAGTLPRRGFDRTGATVYVVGSGKPSLTGSLYADLFARVTNESLPPIDVKIEKSLGKTLPLLWCMGLIASAQNINQGGIAAALAGACLSSGMGVVLQRGFSVEEFYGESAGRVLVSVDAAAIAAFEAESTAAGLPFERIAITSGASLRWPASDGTPSAELPLETLRRAWSDRP